MGTVPEPEPTEEPAIAVFIDRVETVARLLIAGHEFGAVRRITLYVVIAVALVLGGGLVGAVGVAALILLGATDRLL